MLSASLRLLWVLAILITACTISERPAQESPSKLVIVSDRAQPSTSPPANAPEEWHSEMLKRVNTLRASGCQCGGRWQPAVPHLRLNKTLTQIAQAHASDMARVGYFDHTDRRGRSVADRANAAGYNWRAIAENIALGEHTIQSVVAGWQKSEGHCLNMMNAAYSEIGVGQMDRYWVQVFATAR